MSIFTCTKAVDQDKIDEIVEEADQNGDGQISLEEFKVLMSKFF